MGDRELRASLPSGGSLGSLLMVLLANLDSFKFRSFTAHAAGVSSRPTIGFEGKHRRWIPWLAPSTEGSAAAGCDADPVIPMRRKGFTDGIGSSVSWIGSSTNAAPVTGR